MLNMPQLFMVYLIVLYSVNFFLGKLEVGYYDVSLSKISYKLWVLSLDNHIQQKIVEELTDLSV